MGGLLGALAHLVTLIEQFDLLELLVGFLQRFLGVVELGFQLVGGMLEVLAPLDGGLGIGRVGEVGRIVDPRPILLDLDFALQVVGHAL